MKETIIKDENDLFDNSLRIIENDKFTMGISLDYNFAFEKRTGFFKRWGRTVEDDPDYSPFGPEILDLEISSSVRPEDEHLYDKNRLVYDGGCLGKCEFCYKSNGNFPTYNMNIEEFKTILSKMPKTLGQIAFGILNVKTNPDFFPMMEYAREEGIIPNYTCHGFDVTDDIAKRTSELCGAVAVSVYNKDASYNAIKKFTDNGMDQVNIHYMISKETYEEAFNVIDDIKMDNRLSKMNAIVFLSLKQKGGGENFTPISDDQYKRLIDYALGMEVKFGFDSCGAHRFLKAVKNHESFKQFEMMAEPCESSCFSSYVNCKGEYYFCSFCEEKFKGKDVLNCNDFVKEIWNGNLSNSFRKKLIKNGRNCPVYKI